MDSRNRCWAAEATLFGALFPSQPLDYRDRPDPRSWAKVLAEFRLFSGIPKRRLRKLVTQAKLIEHLAGDTVVAVGDPGDSLYVILSGSARARAKPAARMLSVGDYFGELGLIDEAPRSATVVATSELQVMRIPRAAFLRLARRYPAISLNLAGSLGGQIRRLEARLAQA